MKASLKGKAAALLAAGRGRGGSASSLVRGSVQSEIVKGGNPVVLSQVPVPRPGVSTVSVGAVVSSLSESSSLHRGMPVV